MAIDSGHSKRHVCVSKHHLEPKASLDGCRLRTQSNYYVVLDFNVPYVNTRHNVSFGMALMFFFP
jgi:hypothetical protein